MSTINDLIKQLCPDGVQHKELGVIGRFVRGGGLQKKDFTETGVGCIHYGQIYTYYGLSADRTKTFVSVEAAKKLKKASRGDLVLATTSENDNDVCKAVAWLGEDDIAVSGDAMIFKHTENPKFMSYLIQSQSFFDQKKKYITGTKVRRVSSRDLAKIVLPTPPRVVQDEIVNILDKFRQLEAELSAELSARQKQYTHYRNQLLTFDNSVKWVTLGNVCRISRGRVMSKDYLRDNAGGFPVYSSQTANGGVFGTINSFDYDFESITWTTDGANAGSVFYHNNEKFSITNVCGLLRVQEKKLSTKYLYYVLLMLTKPYVNAGMGNPKLMSNVMSTVSIPIPSIDEQNRIVSKLDKFNSLTNDIAIGLPAEISARRKQYEYYRNNLLTFQEQQA